MDPATELVHDGDRAYCPVADCDWWVPTGMEYLYIDHANEHNE